MKTPISYGPFEENVQFLDLTANIIENKFVNNADLFTNLKLFINNKNIIINGNILKNINKSKNEKIITTFTKYQYIFT